MIIFGGSGLSSGPMRASAPTAFWEAVQRLIHCGKFTTAVQHFLLLLQKKTLAKEKEPEGISISPQTPLNRPEKPLRFFWTFPAIAENPMRIRTALWTFLAGRFAAAIQRQLLTNPVHRIRRRVVKNS